MSKLFIIDDDKLTTSRYADFFVSKGFVVASSNTPSGVTTGLKLLLPDVVIVEMNFSWQSGKSLFNIIDNKGGYKVVLISADSQADAMKTLTESGQVDDYFVKGQPLAKLGNKVTRLIDSADGDD